jgi:hypothetical protein
MYQVKENCKARLCVAVIIQDTMIAYIFTYMVFEHAYVQIVNCNVVKVGS